MQHVHRDQCSPAYYFATAGYTPHQLPHCLKDVKYMFCVFASLIFIPFKFFSVTNCSLRAQPPPDSPTFYYPSFSTPTDTRHHYIAEPAAMGYPDTFEGFMINDQKKWTEFKKQEVSIAPSPPPQPSFSPLCPPTPEQALTLLPHSSHPRPSPTTTSTSKSNAVASAVPMCTASTEGGVKCLYPSPWVTKSSAVPLKSDRK